MRAGAGAWAAGTDAFWSEPESEPESPKRFARSRSRSRQKPAPAPKRDTYNCGMKKKQRNNKKQPNKQLT